MHKLAGFLGVLTMVAFAPLAHADLDLSINGTDCVPKLVTGTPPGPPGVTLACPTITSGFGLPSGVTITNFNTTGIQTTGFSQQLTATGSVVNLSGGSVTIMFGAGVSKYSMPTIPPALAVSDSSAITLNSTLGTTSATGTLTSCVDQSDGLVPPDSAFCSSPAPGQAGPNAPVVVNGVAAPGNTTSGVITMLSAPFSLTQELTLVLANNSSLNFTLTQTLTPVPEPGAILLLGTAILGLTTAVRRKARKRS